MWVIPSLPNGRDHLYKEDPFYMSSPLAAGGHMPSIVVFWLPW